MDNKEIQDLITEQQKQQIKVLKNATLVLEIQKTIDTLTSLLTATPSGSCYRIIGRNLYLGIKTIDHINGTNFDNTKINIISDKLVKFTQSGGTQECIVNLDKAGPIGGKWVNSSDIQVKKIESKYIIIITDGSNKYLFSEDGTKIVEDINITYKKHFNIGGGKIVYQIERDTTPKLAYIYLNDGQIVSGERYDAIGDIEKINGKYVFTAKKGTTNKHINADDGTEIKDILKESATLKGTKYYIAEESGNMTLFDDKGKKITKISRINLATAPEIKIVMDTPQPIISFKDDTTPAKIHLLNLNTGLIGDDYSAIDDTVINIGGKNILQVRNGPLNKQTIINLETGEQMTGWFDNSGADYWKNNNTSIQGMVFKFNSPAATPQTITGDYNLTSKEFKVTTSTPGIFKVDKITQNGDKFSVMLKNNAKEIGYLPLHLDTPLNQLVEFSKISSSARTFTAPDGKIYQVNKILGGKYQLINTADGTILNPPKDCVGFEGEVNGVGKDKLLITERIKGRFAYFSFTKGNFIGGLPPVSRDDLGRIQDGNGNDKVFKYRNGDTYYYFSLEKEALIGTINNFKELSDVISLPTGKKIYKGKLTRNKLTSTNRNYNNYYDLETGYPVRNSILGGQLFDVGELEDGPGNRKIYRARGPEGQTYIYADTGELVGGKQFMEVGDIIECNGKKGFITRSLREFIDWDWPGSKTVKNTIGKLGRGAKYTGLGKVQFYDISANKLIPLTKEMKTELKEKGIYKGNIGRKFLDFMDKDRRFKEAPYKKIINFFKKKK